MIREQGPAGQAWRPEFGPHGEVTDWMKKNLQVVVQTTVTDSVPGPPQAVAI